MGCSAAWLLSAGCLEPAAEAPPARVIAGGGRLLEPKLPQARAGLVSYGAHDPRSGRASPGLARRHGLKPYLPEAAGDLATIFAAGFQKTSSAEELDWVRVGNPAVVVLTDHQENRFLRLRGDDTQEISGLAKHLYATPFAGKTVVCQVRTRWPVRRPEQPDAESNPSPPGRAPHPTVRFVILVEGGTEVAVRWPLAWRPTPDWATQRIVWAVPNNVLAIRLEVLVPSADVAADFDDFLIYDPQALQMEGPRPEPDLIPEEPAPGRNLLPGGDFEVGQKCFGLLAYERVPDAADPGRIVTRVATTPWQFDHPAPVGQTCLAVGLNASRKAGATRPGEPPPAKDTVRIWFGPVALERPAGYVVALWARATQSTPLEVSLRIDGEILGRALFTIDQSWRRLSHSFLAMGRHLPGQAYLVVEAPRRHADSPVGMWLDAVSLTNTLAPADYSPPNHQELGIIGPAEDPLDIGHLVDLRDPVEFKTRLFNYDRRAFVGEVCLDVVDALDRVVWTTNLPCKLGPAGHPKSVLESTHRLHLGRGYYRILAAAWLGAEGNGQPVSRAVRPFGVLNLTDALPEGAPIGMPVAPGRFSQRMTQWGVGWARVALEGAAASNDPQGLAELLEDCRRQRLEIVGECSAVGGALPAPVGRHSIVPVSRLARLRKANKGADGNLPWEGLVVRLGGNSAPADQVRLFAGGDAAASSRAFEWAGPAGPLPEDAESELDRLTALEVAGQPLSWWERALPVAPSTNLPIGLRAERVTETDGAVRRAPLDPALEASELVRGLAVRLWYGFERVALATYPFQPVDPTAGSSFVSGGAAAAPFSEYDHSPKPVLAAVDFAAEMLNDAVPAEWIDGYLEARALCFERPDGNGVALLWRPLGVTASLHRLAGLGSSAGRASRGPDSVKVFNCFGQDEPCRRDGNDLILPVSSRVLYVWADAKAWPRLREALPAALAAPVQGTEPP